MTYKAPVRDLAFALEAVADLGRLQDAFPTADAETVNAVLAGVGALAEEVLAPLNRTGDVERARYENGGVIAAPGFVEAYRRFAQDGWTSLSADPAYGGQGLPKALEMALFEIVQAANLSFGLCPLLTLSGVEVLTRNGTERQKSLYLPKMVTGEWTGTMLLTEPQAGTDLGALATRAEPDGDGWRLHGQKIFITWGDHDLTQNIVHLVLARLPDAPAGTQGLSLFLASKRLLGEDGSLQGANDIRPASIEHKLGLNASPTCVMLLDGARAELVGEPHRGLAAMFVMMNAARLGVGVQGVGMAERAYQQALAYAQDRKQGRSVWTGAYPSPIVDHPDVRRSLLLTKAKIEAARAICLSAAVAADLAKTAADAEARERADLRLELLTPIAKAWSTDLAVEATSTAIQVHGGMGFIEETGVAQLYRDARILPIYEGTNGVQAMDLVRRKIALAGGQALRDLGRDIEATLVRMDALPQFEGAAQRLRTGLRALQGAAAWLAERRQSAEADALAGATTFLKLAGDVVGGWMLAKGALAAADLEPDYGRLKTGLARLYGEQILSQAPGLAEAVMAGAADLELAQHVLG